MAVTRTIRENYLGMMKGEAPDFLLQFSYGGNPYSKRPPVGVGVSPSILRDGNGNRDLWGVPFVANREAGFAPLPEPGNYILDDITKWRDVIKAPDFSDVDWEKVAKMDLDNLAKSGIDTRQSATFYHLHNGLFQSLMGMMGFVEGLCAIQEEPEEVMALFDYMSSFYEDIAKKTFKYYNPDMYLVNDDVAAWNAPFISPTQYREMVKPFQIRESQIGRDHDLPLAMHCCGKCDMLVDDWVEFGVHYWEPPQSCNDLVSIQKKHGNNLILVGGFDVLGEQLSPNYSEEQFKQDVRDNIDALKENAFFVFNHWLFGDPDNELFNSRNRWMTEVVESYGLDLWK